MHSVIFFRKKSFPCLHLHHCAPFAGRLEVNAHSNKVFPPAPSSTLPLRASGRSAAVAQRRFLPVMQQKGGAVMDRAQVLLYPRSNPLLLHSQMLDTTLVQRIILFFHTLFVEKLPWRKRIRCLRAPCACVLRAVAPQSVSRTFMCAQITAIRQGILRSAYHGVKNNLAAILVLML